MSEHVLLNENGVTVTTSRVVVGDTTYALKNITSVKIAKTPAKKGCAVLLAIGGSLSLLLGISAVLGFYSVDWSDFDDLKGVLFYLLMGAAMAICGITWYKSLSDDHHVVFATSGGEVKALNSKDGEFIRRVVEKINDAMARG